MKELSIEDKAKRYDEAIIKFKPIYDLAKEQGRTIDVKEFENIFPELKKFEDDDIKKWLIGYFNQYIIDGMPQVFGNGLNVKDVIAWLEKQGKQKSADNIEPKFKVGDWVVNTITNEVEQVIELTDGEYICSGHLIVSFNNQHILRKIQFINTWKPSEEQIAVLEWQIKNTDISSWQYHASKELLQDLKKLKE